MSFTINPYAFGRPISYQGDYTIVTVASTTSGSGITVTTPSNTTNGDVLVCFCMVDTDGRTWTDDGSWTTNATLQQSTPGGTALTMYTFYKILSSSPSASYDFSVNISSRSAKLIMARIQSAATYDTASEVITSGTTADIPTFTVGTNGCVLVAYAGNEIIGTSTVTGPTNYTEIIQESSNSCTLAAFYRNNFSGATGTLTGTFSSSQNNSVGVGLSFT